MTTNSNNNEPPIRAAEILDPYPERSTSLGGVRPYTPVPHRPDRMVTTRRRAGGPFPFAAKLQTRIAAWFGRRWFPVASTALYVAGQLILALTIATGHVPAGFGVGVCLSWLVCGLLLIAAQTIAPRPETPRSVKELSE